MFLNDARWSMHQLNGRRRGRSAERHQYRFVGSAAMPDVLLLRASNGWKQKCDLLPGRAASWPNLRGSRRLVLPDQSAQFPQEQHRLTAPWRLLLAGRCGTEAGVRLGRWRLLSGKAWQAGASREVNVPVEEKVPLVVLLVRVAPLSSWLTGLRQRPAARGAAASFPGLPPPYRDGETAAIGARGF